MSLCSDIQLGCEKLRIDNTSQDHVDYLKIAYDHLVETTIYLFGDSNKPQELYEVLARSRYVDEFKEFDLALDIVRESRGL